MSTTTQNAAVAAFETTEQAQQAVRDLRTAGFREGQIGVAALDRRPSPVEADGDTYAAEGAAAGALGGMGLGGLWAIGIAAGALPAIGPAVAGGLLASVLTSAAAGAAMGSVTGALVGLGVAEDQAARYQLDFEAGRTIVTVYAGERRMEALTILHRNGGASVEASE